MDVASAALSNAWLQAVARIQSQRPPQPPVPHAERTLTDVIEGALRRGTFEPSLAERLDPTRSGRLVDRLV